eukprot:gene9042-2966_t
MKKSRFIEVEVYQGHFCRGLTSRVNLTTANTTYHYYYYYYYYVYFVPVVCLHV